MARPGRKRKSNVKRHPNGRINQRAAREAHVDERRDNIEARRRVFGLSEDQAKAMPEGTELGRLATLGLISRRQYEAGSMYRQIVQRRDWAMGLPKIGSGSDLERVDGAPGSDVSQVDLAKYKRAMARWDVCRLALDRARLEQRNVVGIVDALVLRDLRRDHHLIALRVGLNRIAEALRLPDASGSGVIVSDHALLRWLERSKGFDIAGLRAEMASAPEVIRAIKSGARAVGVAGSTFILEGRTVTTVLKQSSDEAVA